MALSKIKSDSVDSIAATKLTGTVDNARITLDAAEIPNLDAAKITTGSIANARVPAAAVTQHVTAADLTPAHQGIANLGLIMATEHDKVAFNLTGSFIDIFQDNSGITTETNVDRNASEYVSSVTSSTTVTTPSSASDYTGSTGSATIGSGTVTWNVGDKSMRSTNSVSGDFEFTGRLTAGDGSGGWLGAFPVSEVGTFADGHEAGSMRSMTNSFFLAWTSRAYATNGSNKGSAIQTTFNPNTNEVFKLTRVGSTIKYFIDGVLYTTLTSQTTADMYLCIGGGGSTGIAYTGLSWSAPAETTNATGTLISDAQTVASTTEVSGVFTYTDSAGTNTIGTDLKIYFTANNGTNWTEAASYGTATTFSGSVKQVKLGKTTVTAGTQVALKAVWANQVATVAGGALPIDSSSNSHTLTAVADATTSTVIYKSGVGTQSMEFDGTGDWYTVPDGSWADLGTGDFTMEAWVYYTGGSGYKGIIGSGNWGGPNYNWSWDMNSANAYPRLSIYNGSTEVFVQMTTALATSTWTHLAVCRSSGTTTQYLNGTANGTTVASTHNVASAGVVYIGNQSRGIPWQGNLQEVRMSNNARYTGTFTPSASAFVSDANTLLLAHGTGTAGVTGKIAHLNGWAVNY